MNEKQLLDLCDSVGQFIEYWGFKKIHGKIWAYVYLVDREVSSKELKEVFSISKGLLSMTLNDLKDYKVLFETGKGRHGAELVKANPHIFEAICEVLQKREKTLIKKVHEQTKLLKSLNKAELQNTGISAKKINSLDKLVSGADKTLSAIIKLEQVNLRPWKNFGSE